MNLMDGRPLDGTRPRTTTASTDVKLAKTAETATKAAWEKALMTKVATEEAAERSAAEDRRAYRRLAMQLDGNLYVEPWGL